MEQPNKRVFRLGLYLGRHAAEGGGIALYSRELLGHYSRLLAEDAQGDGDASDVELFVYDSHKFLEGLNGASEPKLHRRKLPEKLGRKWGLLIDLLLVGLYARRDRVHLLHSTSNYGCLSFGIPQLITVHDLYQAWPPAGSRGLGLARWFYRILFQAQLPRVFHVVTDAPSVASEVQRLFGRRAQNTSVVPLGIESELVRYLHSETKSASDAWLSEQKLRPGYVLAFGSSDPRKNFRRALAAWSQLPEPLRARGLTVKLNDEQAQKLLHDALGEKEMSRVRIIPWLSRVDLFRLYQGAGASLIPSVAEGFGFPALESVALNCRVVSPELDCLKSIASDLVFFCDPLSVESIASALEKSLTPGPEGRSAAAQNVHSMCQAAKDTFRLSRDLMDQTL